MDDLRPLPQQEQSKQHVSCKFSCCCTPPVLISCVSFAAHKTSENHTTEQAIHALRRAGVTVDSCVKELPSSSEASIAKPSVADEELVSNTLEQIESLMHGLVAEAPEGEILSPYPYFATDVQDVAVLNVHLFRCGCVTSGVALPDLLEHAID